ncbi:hypothetical protein KKC74_14165 [bacterium]|nr:hypothetical protein [bacterium]MBU1065929.1 hypothetical protein [bacterium]
MTGSIHASGEMQKDTDKIVESVWRHFIFDRLQPYAEKITMQNSRSAMNIMSRNNRSQYENYQTGS